jgi:hypothetical protein
VWRRSEAKNLPTELSGTLKTTLLADLAHRMMDAQTRDIAHDEAIVRIEATLARVRRGVTPEEFLADIVASGLLVEREHKVLAFAHLTFQEYLASTQVDGKALATRVKDPWWRETTLLYVARGGDADPIVRACLNDRTIESLSLAFDCVEDDVPLAPELRRGLAAVLEDAFRNRASQEHRRLVAGVLAQRHFRSPKQASTGARVFPPIPANLYRLFLLTTSHPAPDGALATSPDATTPVTGVWGEDARAFIAWLHSLAPAFSVRLPTAEELDETLPGVEPVWCLDADGHVTLHTTTETVPQAVSLETLIDRVADDVAKLHILRLLGTIRLRLTLDIVLQYLARAVERRHGGKPPNNPPVLHVVEMRDRRSITSVTLPPARVTTDDQPIIDAFREVADMLQESRKALPIMRQAALAHQAMRHVDLDLVDPGVPGDPRSSWLLSAMPYLAARVPEFRTMLVETSSVIGHRDQAGELMAQAALTSVLGTAFSVVLDEAGYEDERGFARAWVARLPQYSLSTLLRRSELPPLRNVDHPQWPMMEALAAEYQDLVQTRPQLSPDKATNLRIRALALASLRLGADRISAVEEMLEIAVAVTALQERRDHPEFLERLVLARD